MEQRPHGGAGSGALLCHCVARPLQAGGGGGGVCVCVCVCVCTAGLAAVRCCVMWMACSVAHRLLMAGDRGLGHESRQRKRWLWWWWWWGGGGGGGSGGACVSVYFFFHIITQTLVKRRRRPRSYAVCNVHRNACELYDPSGHVQRLYRRSGTAIHSTALAKTNYRPVCSLQFLWIYGTLA